MVERTLNEHALNESLLNEQRVPEPRPELRALQPAVHGGDAPAGVLDFSTGVSPLPPPPELLAAIRGADVTRYPHPTALPLREAIAAKHRVSPGCVVAGAGSVELIWALARAFGGPGRRVAYVAPAFAEYAQATRASGGEAVAVAAVADAAVAACALVFVARPGNPTLAIPDVAHSRAPLTVVDEAYQPLCDDVAPLPATENRAILRSLTKVFALPGLRLGYLIATESVARVVQAVLPPWNVSQPAIAAGVAALALPTEPVRDAVRELRRRMIDRLRGIGVTPRAAAGSFVLVDVGDSTRFTAAMLERGVRVRDCISFGLHSTVRLGVRGDADQERLVAAWQGLT